MNADPIRILVVDDDREFRQGLQALLGTVERVSVIGEAATGAEAVVRVAALQPDLVLMDLSMPQVNGIEATRSITGSSPHVAVLMLTMFEDDESVLAAMRAGARGYILKGAGRAEIVRAIEAATEGGVIFGPGVARRVLSRLAGAEPQTVAPFPRAHHARTRHPDARCPRPQQRRHRWRAHDQFQDRAEPRPQHLQQAPDPEPSRSDHPSP